MRPVSMRKAFRDLWENKARSLLVLAALIVGIIGVGTVAVAYAILPREMNANYMATDPSSATLWVSPLDDGAVAAAAAMPGISEAEARWEIVGRFLAAPGEWRELWLYVIPDFKGMRLDRFTPESGAWPPAAGEILLERTAVGVAGAKTGDPVMVKIPARQELTLRFAGTVHAPALPPAWVENRVYGYITPETLALFGGEPLPGQLKILVSDTPMDKAAITKTAYALRDRLSAGGRTVSRVDIPEPGKHVHADLMAAFIVMLGAMGLLALLMSGVLVTVMITAIMGRQIRQIGIMKAMGGRAWRIGGMYAGMILILGAAAVAVGMPVSIALGRALARYEAVEMLNFQIFDYGAGLRVYLGIVAVGLAVPLAAGAVPILRGGMMTVASALSQTGAGRGRFGSRPIDRMLGRVRGGFRIFLLSLRNAFRRGSRLALTLVTLTVAGASFITAMNTAASIDSAIAAKFAAAPYDIEIAFSRTYPKEDVEGIIRGTGGVALVQTWGTAYASTLRPDGLQDRQLRLSAPLLGTGLTPRPQILRGRWLLPDDSGAIVMSDAMLAALRLEARVGESITLDIAGRKTVWRLVGITREFMAGSAYVSQEPPRGAVSVVVKVSDAGRTPQVARALEERLRAAGLDVYTLWKTGDARVVVEKHMALIVGILLVMAALFVIIGGLGISSAMSLNVLDRIRELGIMRAIGATGRSIMGIIVIEGAFVGALSWLLSAGLSFACNAAMSRVFGMLLQNPIVLVTSLKGWLSWLGVILAVASLASALPAWGAARLRVRETLAYE